jgi:peptide/nickel transport system permease protein
MAGYLTRRLGFALLLVFVVSSGALLLTRLAPGDITSEQVGTGVSAAALAAERTRLGLDLPLSVQYARWLRRAVTLDFGTSLMYGRPVASLLAERARNTALLALASLVAATLVGLPLGVISGSSRRRSLVALIRAGSLVALSMPSLLTSLVLVLVAARTGWFPTGGMTSLTQGDAAWSARSADVAWHMVLPALALALPIAATLERLQSQSMALTLAEPFVAACAARGVPARRLVWHHALRPAVRPVVAIYGLIFGSLLSGSFVVEIVTAWPGLGRLMFDGLRSRDLYLVAGCAAAGGGFLALGGLLSDLALAAIDPRLRGHAEGES